MSRYDSSKPPNFKINQLSYYGCALEIRPDDPRQLEWEAQRLTLGFDDTETWSLDITLAQFIEPRLRRLRELDFRESDAERIGQIDRALEALTLIIQSGEDTLHLVKYGDQIKAGLHDLAEVWLTLWT